MIGRRLPSRSPGVHTLRNRQSSLAPAGFHSLGHAGSGFCIDCGPYVSASRTPLQAFNLGGGLKRFSPAGEPAYGTPLKMLSPSWTAPRNWPCVVLAITVFSGFV